VSMNLLDLAQTPLHVAYEAVRARAQQHGVRVRASELVGLLPTAALAATSAWALQLPALTPHHAVETRLLELLARQSAQFS
jgi:glutamate formiminotransferase